MYIYYNSSWKARIGLSFSNKSYVDVGFNCYSDKFEESKLYEVNCNATNDDIRLKIPKEGTKKCVQVSSMPIHFPSFKPENFWDFNFVVSKQK